MQCYSLLTYISVAVLYVMCLNIATGWLCDELPVLLHRPHGPLWQFVHSSNSGTGMRLWLWAGDVCEVKV